MHRHLLDGRALDRGKVYHTALADETCNLSTGDDIKILTVKVNLDSMRAIEMWSRWLYGQPMWSEDDCTDVEDDLSSLADVVYLCGGRDGSGRDYEGLNACMDAVRDIMLNDIHVPENPISLLLDRLEGSEIMVQMLAKLLVHGKCARDGRTKKWLQQNEGGIRVLFEVVSNEFAKKAMGEEAPDIMARCAYHIHVPGSSCEPRGSARSGMSIQRKAFENMKLTDPQILKTARTRCHSVKRQSLRLGH